MPAKRAVYIYIRKIISLFGYRKGVSFILSMLLMPTTYARWFDFLETRLPIDVSETLRYTLGYKIARPYLRRWLTTPNKIDVLKYHYGLFSHTLSPIGLRSLQEGILYAQFTGTTGREYSLIVRAESNREGEISIHFMDVEIKAILSSIRGVFRPDDEGHPEFWIGGMQGPKPPIGSKEISRVTRDLNIMRPKQAVLHAVAAFAGCFGAQRLIAPRLKNHVSYRWWRYLFPTRLIYSEFDQFWNETVSGRDNNGDYVLNIPFPRREAKQVPSKHRKDWVARYERLNSIAKATIDMCNAISQNGERLRPAPARPRDYRPRYHVGTRYTEDFLTLLLMVGLLLCVVALTSFLWLPL
ncbi:MAG: DUF535 family protein [Bryobacteraceae bacterium]